MGACATFLYNLETAMNEIRSGRRRVAIVGNSEAPILPEIMDGYAAMGALGDDARLKAINKTDQISHVHRASSCRPFSENCGFTLSESSQYVVLFDDELVMETGAQIHGAVGDIFINADGYKKSISSPGFGNYLTLAKAAASVKAILGHDSLKHRTFVSAHGSGTPLNRTTESHALNEIAKAFKIENWPVCAIKCYLGHPLAQAAGEQVITALGTWAYGWIPGIFTLEKIAEDVHQAHLNIFQKHMEVGPDNMEAAFINSKGFGGNNATGTILSPHIVLKMLEKKYGKRAMVKYQTQNEPVTEKARQYDKESICGQAKPIYKPNETLLGENDLELDEDAIKISGVKNSIDLNIPNPYPDMSLI